MKEILAFVKKQYLKLIPHIILLLSIIFSYFTEDGSSLNLVVKITLSTSFALSLYFTINITNSFNKYLNSVVISQRNIISEYRYKISNYEMQFKNLIYKPKYYKIEDMHEPYLAIDIVPYRIKGSFFPLQHEEDYIEYIDENIVETPGKTYYCYVNGDKVNFSVEKDAIIQDYYHDTMGEMKIKNGTALVNKPRHLIVFKLINIGLFPAKSVLPIIDYNNNENNYKGIHAKLLQSKEELLFVILVELQGEKKINYNCAFEYSFKNKRLIQKMPITIENSNITFLTELSEPEEITPLPIEN